MPKRSDLIAKRAMMAAQMAVVLRTETKELIKELRHSDSAVVPYYAQAITTMISRITEITGNVTAMTLASLKLLEEEGDLSVAEALSQSAAHQALSAKCLFHALVTTLKSGN